MLWAVPKLKRLELKVRIDNIGCNEIILVKSFEIY